MIVYLFTALLLMGDGSAYVETVGSPTLALCEEKRETFADPSYRSTLFGSSMTLFLSRCVRITLDPIKTKT